jgi:predicted permease
VNQAFARKYWPNEDAIGKRFGFAGRDAPLFTVIGVVGDVRQMQLDTPSEPELFVSGDQVTNAGPFNWPKTLVVRTQGEPLAIAAALRNAVWDVDPNQPVSDVRSMGDVFDVELADRNTQLTLVGAFAALALLLAAAGLYGVLSYAVAQRSAEIGLRMALGAQRANVVRNVLRSAFSLAVVGLAIGVAGALGAARLIASFLYGVSPADPATFVAVAGVILGVALLASYVPARRAASVDPMTALRMD